jgi:hypothetical protein
LILHSGISHSDQDGRNSASYDLMEPARPILDSWFFHWLKRAAFAKRDFFEDYRGAIRIMRPLTSHLAMTAVLWRGTAAQLGQWFHKQLSGENVPLRLRL